MELPTGTVTFLISDIEGSTRLAANLGPDWPDVLGEHAALIRKAVTEVAGVEVSTEGDSFFCVFVDPDGGIAGRGRCGQVDGDAQLAGGGSRQCPHRAPHR